MTRGAVEVFHEYQSGGGADRCHRDNPEIRDHSARANNWLNQGFPEIGDYGTTRVPFRLNCDVKLMTVISIRVPRCGRDAVVVYRNHPARCWSPCRSFGPDERAAAVAAGVSEAFNAEYRVGCAGATSHCRRWRAWRPRCPAQ